MRLYAVRKGAFKMAKYISRNTARMETSRLNSRLGILDKEARNYVVRLSGLPESAGCIACLEWLDGFGNWIESAYNGKATTYEEMASELNSERKRKFTDRKGKTVGYCRVLIEYLGFMCRAENYGKRYTMKQFKSYVSEYYKEVTA